MPPKGRKRAATPPSNGKKKVKKHSGQQPSIDAFFTSPSKKSGGGSVISISDDEIEVSSVNSKVHKAPLKQKVGGLRGDSPVRRHGNGQIDKDEEYARELSRAWAMEAEKSPDKGKGRALSQEREEDEDADEGIVAVDPPYSPAPGVNGSSSSTHRLPPTPKGEPASPVKPKVVKGTNANGPLAPMFMKSETGSKEQEQEEPMPNREPKEEESSPIRELPSGDGTKPDVKPSFPFSKPVTGSGTNGTSGSITSASTEAAEPIDFDVDAFTFRPETVDTSRWPKGRLPYSVLVGVYVQVSSTRSRLMIVRVLTNFLHLLLKVSPVDLPSSLYLLSNHLLPSYLPCELGIGSQILSKAVQEVSGLQPRDLKKLWEKWGDPGDVAYEAKSNLRTLIRPSPLLVGDVYKRMVGLSRIKGQQSGKVKGDVVRKLMVQARGEEVRFLVRSLVGNLRIGAVRLTLLTSLARATSLHHAAPALLNKVLPLPVMPPKPPPGQKRPPKPKPIPDPAREQVEELCVEAVKLVRRVYVRHPNYGDLVKGIADGGLDGLAERVPVSVGIPLSPMLGSITRSLSDVFTRLGSLPFTAEAKLDGQRVQIHARRRGPQGEDDGGGRWVENDEGDKIWVRLFSRHLEDMTEKYPDICQMILSLLLRPLPPKSSRPSFPSTASDPSPTLMDILSVEKVESFIMDAEVVAIDKTTGVYRTFQELTNRAKKDVRVEDIKVVVGIFAFDLMLLNDQPLLGAPFSHRRHVLRTLFPSFSPPASNPLIARFKHVECLDSYSCTDVTAEMQAFFETVVEQKCEGLMVKLLESGEGITGDDEDDEGDGSGQGGGKKKKVPGTGTGTGGKKKPLPATYEPDQRSQGWLKVKKDYLEGLGDSLDLVPIGAWWGQGRKAGWWSPILLACHNAESGALEAVCKCISGFTDQFYKDLIVRYPPHNALPEKCNTDSQLSYCDTGGLRPDVWFSPDEVWEIRGADITLSPVYPAAASLLGSERGLSIRFPRFMKLREDKSWEQATSSEQFAGMYREQIKAAPARDQVDGPPVPVAPMIRRGSEEAEGPDAEGEGEYGDEDDADDDVDDVGDAEEAEEADDGKV